MRLAQKMQTSVVSNTSTIPTIGCQGGTPGGTDWRSTINIGVAGGNSDIRTDNDELGSLTM